MTAHTATTAPHTGLRLSRLFTAEPAGAARDAFWLLRITFVVAPLVFGLDKFAGVLTNWDRYLAPQIDNLVPGTTHQAMLAVGVIEVVAAIVLAVVPRFGAYIVALWLAGIIINLLLIGGYADIALRDFGLLLAALALGRLAAGRHGAAAARHDAEVRRS
jgi:hypothetical protein